MGASVVLGTGVTVTVVLEGGKAKLELRETVELVGPAVDRGVDEAIEGEVVVTTEGGLVVVVVVVVTATGVELVVVVVVVVGNGVVVTS